MTVRRTAVAGAALLVALPIAACSSADKAVSVPSVGTPTATAPAFPKTREGAAAFVRHYWNVYNDAASTGVVVQLEDLSLRSCRSCQNIIDFIDRAYSDGGRIIGTQIVVVDAATPPFDADTAVVSLIADQSFGRVLDNRGVIQHVTPTVHRVDSEMTLAWTTRGWRVSDITKIGSQ